MRFILIIASVLWAMASQAQTAITVNAGNNNQTISTCNGFIIDSGGQGGPGYGNNEDVTITICPDTPGDIISIVFNLFNLNTTDDNPAPGPNNVNVDYMYIYDGTSTSANSLGVYEGNGLQGVVIHATPQNPSGCITIRFVSNSVGTGMFSASATCQTPCNDPVAAGAILGGITSDSIHVCLGEAVNFQDAGSYAQPGFTIASYKWDFMDGTTAMGTNVSHTYTVPGHYRVQLFVTDDNDDNTCTNNNLIDLQVLVATKPSFIGFPADTTICLGESLTATAVPDDYEVTWNGFVGHESIDDGCLPDTLLGVAQEIDILQTGFAAGTTITSASQVQSICVELEHSFMGDLVIYLTCPNGQSVMLHQQGGGGTQIGIPNQLDNVDCSDPTTQGVPFTYCFTNSATQTWVDWVNNSGFGATLPAGNYAPIQPISNLVGCPTNGVWTLTVVDNWAADDGTLFSFGLTLDPALYPNLVQFTPQIGHGADSSYWVMPSPFATVSPDGDVLSVNPTMPGTYTYNYVVIDNFGCTNDTSFVLTVNDNLVPNAGPDINICGSTAQQLNATLSGNGGGSPCPFTISLHDSYGDGWNGNNLLVTINGVTTSYTIASGSDAVFTVTVPHGANVTAQFQASGSWQNECEYQIIGPNNNVVIQQGQNGATPTTAPNTVFADCFNGYTFQWSPPTYLNNPNIANPVGTFQAAQTLVLSTYPNGHPLCVTRDTLIVTLLPSAYPGHDSTLTICATGAPQDLFPLLGPGASVNGGWFIGNNNTPVSMPYDPVTMNPGIYKYRVDSAGCVSQAKITVTEINTAITSVTPSNVTCNSGNNGSAIVLGTNFTSYSLNGGAPVQAVSPATIAGLTAGSYTVEVFGPAGCSDVETFTITEPDSLQIDFLTNDTLICLGSSITLSAAGSGGSSPYTYTWTENNVPIGQGETITVTPPVAYNSYCVTLSEACGSPTATECMTVGNPQEIIPMLSPDKVSGCFPVSIEFTNTTASTEIATTTIAFGDGDTATYQGTETFTHEYKYPGVFTVHVTIVSSYGCVYESTFTNMIEAYDYPVANFNILPNGVSFFDPTVELNNTSSPDAVTFQWHMPSGTPDSANTENTVTTYPMDLVADYPVTLIVIDEHGCPDTVTKVVNVISDIVFYAPNSFTPNGDEANNTWNFVIDGVDVNNLELRIYNRWGEMIWENHDPAVGWDGTYNGMPVQSGTYPWTLEVKDLNSDKKFRFRGHISVLR